jgi:hypothetical protein
MRVCFTDPVTVRPYVTKDNFGLCNFCIDLGSFELFPMSELTRYSTTEYTERGYRVVLHQYICKQCAAPSSRPPKVVRTFRGKDGKVPSPKQRRDSGSAGLTVFPEEEPPHEHS